MDKIIKQQGNKQDSQPDVSKLSDDEFAGWYISQLVDLRCVQLSQPGDIIPYLAIEGDRPSLTQPALMLKLMGMKAVPALLKALDDDTPTRTVYHWRDFAHERMVWRVSDFAWNILRDITKKDFGYRPAVGFTLSSMKPAEKQQAIAEVRKWYNASKSLSEDDRMLAFFESQNPEDWTTAATYFQKKKDARAVAPILKVIGRADGFEKGKLCELVGGFGDNSAKPVLQNVLKTASEPADRMSAAIGLWELGDKSGVPVAIDDLKLEKQPYGNWEEPIWFLMKSKTPEGIDALQSVVMKAKAQCAGEVIETIASSVTGRLWGTEREPAGCVEICPVLISAMGRSDYTGGTVNDVKVRINDAAARRL